MRQKPRPHEIYKHFKGKYYQVLSIALHSETGEEMVVYQQLYEPFGVYVRSLDMFMSPVDKVKYPEVLQEYRFEKVQEPAWEIAYSKNMTAGEVTEQGEIRQSDEKKNDKAEEKVKDCHVGPVSFSEEHKSLEEDAELAGVDSGLLDFLEADSYEKKLEILSMLHPRINDHMIDTMAVSLDIEVKDGDIEQRYSEILNCLVTMEKFECNRLR